MLNAQEYFISISSFLAAHPALLPSIFSFHFSHCWIAFFLFKHCTFGYNHNNHCQQLGTKCHVHLVKESKRWTKKKFFRFDHNEYCAFTYQNYGKRKQFSLFQPAIPGSQYPCYSFIHGFYIVGCAGDATQFRQICIWKLNQNAMLLFLIHDKSIHKLVLQCQLNTVIEK